MLSDVLRAKHPLGPGQRRNPRRGIVAPFPLRTLDVWNPSTKARLFILESTLRTIVLVDKLRVSGVLGSLQGAREEGVRLHLGAFAC